MAERWWWWVVGGEIKKITETKSRRWIEDGLVGRCDPRSDPLAEDASERDDFAAFKRSRHKKKIKN